MYDLSKQSKYIKINFCIIYSMLILIFMCVLFIFRSYTLYEKNINSSIDLCKIYAKSIKDYKQLTNNKKIIINKETNKNYTQEQKNHDLKIIQNNIYNCKEEMLDALLAIQETELGLSIVGIINNINSEKK